VISQKNSDFARHDAETKLAEGLSCLWSSVGKAFEASRSAWQTRQ
jgi:hypothetical protein